MKYCTKCGARLVEGAKFCTVCGSRVDCSAPAENVQATSEKENTFVAVPAAETAQPRRKFMWGILTAVLALVLIVGAAGAFFFRSGMFESAPTRFVRIHRQMIDPAVNFSVETVTKQLNDRRTEKVREYTGIDTDFTVTVDMETGSDTVDEIINDSSVTFMVKAGDSVKPLFGFIVNLSGSDVLSGTLVVDKDNLGIYLPELSDEYYKLYYDDLADILKKIGVDSGVDIQAIIDSFYSTESPLGIDSGKLEAIISSYLDIFFSMVKDENTTSSKEDVLLPGCGEKISCTVLTFKPSASDITEMVKAFCDKLKDDDDLREIVRNIAEYAYISNASMADQYETSEDYVNFILKSYDDMVKNLWDKYEEDIIECANNVEENEICWKIAYKGVRVHMISLTDKDQNGIGYESVGNVLEGRTDMVVTYEEGKADKIAESQFKLTGKNAEGSVNIYKLDDGTAKIEYSFNLSQKSGLKIPYGALSFQYGDIKADVKVDSEGTGSLHDIRIKADDKDIRVQIYSTDKPATISEPKGDPVKVTSENLMEVLQGMYGKIMEIAVNIYG